MNCSDSSSTKKVLTLTKAGFNQYNSCDYDFFVTKESLLETRIFKVYVPTNFQSILSLPILLQQHIPKITNFFIALEKRKKKPWIESKKSSSF